MNKGHESMVYLNYIVEHFDDLAPLTLFIHGHLESWHQDWNMDETIRTLNLTEVAKEGYVNLRCDWAHGCKLHSVSVFRRCTRMQSRQGFPLLFNHDSSIIIIGGSDTTVTSGVTSYEIQIRLHQQETPY